MIRRHFVGQMAIISAAATLTGSAACREEEEEGSPSSGRPQLDPSDRSPNRDPLEVQRATLVVEGRDAGRDTVEQLERLRTGGVNGMREVAARPPASA